MAKLVKFMKVRINNADYTLTDQRYDWIIRSFGHNNPDGTWETDWDQVIRYFEEFEKHKTEIKDEPEVEYY